MPKPQIDEQWVVRVSYWGEEPRVTVVHIYYVWKDGTIDFIPFALGEGDEVRSTQCAQFELLERVELEKWL